MSRWKNFTTCILILALLFVFVACTERVPAGFNGMVQLPDGLTGIVLSPGNHKVVGRDRLILWERAEVAKTEKLKILCKDDLNFGFDLKLRGMVSDKDVKAVMYVLDRQGSKIKWNKTGDIGILAFDAIYNTYIKDPARSAARRVVSQYATTEIRDKRVEIEKDLKKEILKAIEGTPVKITFIASSNFDYPKVVTDAVESMRKKEIEIGEERAAQAMDLLRMENRLVLAEKAKVVRAAEAEKDAVYVKIMGKALDKQYLELRAIERDIILYEKAAAGATVIVTNGNAVMPIINTTGVTLPLPVKAKK